MNSKFKKYLYILLVICFIIVLMLTLYFITDKEECRFWNMNCKKTNVEKYSYIDFEDVVGDELYILFRFNSNGQPYSSINDITSYDILTLIFNRIESAGEINTISKSEIEDIYYKATCFGKLNILKHENYDNFIYDNEKSVYKKNTDMVSNRYNLYAKAVAKNYSNFRKENGKYYIDTKYLFTDNLNSDNISIYGSMNDLSNPSKKLVSLKNDVDFQIYFDENYSDLESNLDTYHYVFEVVDDKISLIEFSVN